jgi:hypothetical protein
VSTTLESTTFASPILPQDWTFADLQQHLGDVPANRIRVFPAPGTATEEDALQIRAREDRRANWWTAS